MIRGFISIVIGIINQLITGGGPHLVYFLSCGTSKSSQRRGDAMVTIRVWASHFVFKLSLPAGQISRCWRPPFPTHGLPVADVGGVTHCFWPVELVITTIYVAPQQRAFVGPELIAIVHRICWLILLGQPWDSSKETMSRHLAKLCWRSCQFSFNFS